LLTVEKVKDRNVVLAEAQVLKSLAERFGVKKEVRDDDDEGPLLDFFRCFVDRSDEAGLAFRFQLRNLIEDESEMLWTAAGRGLPVGSDRAAVESDGIALLSREISESSGKAAGVIEAG